MKSDVTHKRRKWWNYGLSEGNVGMETACGVEYSLPYNNHTGLRSAMLAVSDYKWESVNCAKCLDVRAAELVRKFGATRPAGLYAFGGIEIRVLDSAADQWMISECRNGNILISKKRDRTKRGYP